MLLVYSNLCLILHSLVLSEYLTFDFQKRNNMALKKDSGDKMAPQSGLSTKWFLGQNVYLGHSVA